MSSQRSPYAPERLLDDAAQIVDSHSEPRRTLQIALVAPPVLPIPPQRYAGTERVVAALADGLVARGHHVTLFASGDSTAGSETVAVIPRAAWRGRSTGDTAIYGMLAAMAALEQADRFDVVHSHVDVMSLPLARQARVPVLTTFHARLDLPGLYEAVEAFGRAPLVAISQSQRRWHPHANWIATIPHGLPLQAMPFGAEPGPYLAVVGRATPEKGIAEAIEVATASSFPLRIAAKALDASERAYLDTHVRPALGNGVEYLGEVGADERDPLLAGARATLMLGAWPEPFGLVAIESLATGTPVIARRAGALAEIIEHGVDGYLVDDLSEAKLAVSLVEDLDRARIRERAIARFSVERMVSAYERVYRSLVDGRDADDGRDRAVRRPSSVPSVVGVPVTATTDELDGHRTSA